MDSAFGGIQRLYLIISLQDDLFLGVPTEEERNVEVHLKREASPKK